MKYYENISSLSHIGDILAIPCFAILSYYLYNIDNKTYVEYLLLAFSVAGFILDIIFTTIHFLYNQGKC